MAVKDSVRAIPISAFNSAALLPATWQAITPAGGIPSPCSIIIIKNRSNRTIQVSYNNTDINEVVLADSVLELDLQTNSSPNNYVALMQQGTEISFQGAIGGAGFIYLSGYYQEVQ